MKKIRIGARGSKLSLYQANLVKNRLEEAVPSCTTEVVIIQTKGDKILDSPLSKIGDKGLFTREIEAELIAGTIDLAVHSLKDLPTEFPKGLMLGAVLKRAEVRDVLISRNGEKLKDFTGSEVIGTSSLRRIAQILKFNSSFTIKDIRGNVDTRIRKLEEGQYDAIILAGAGVTRLGLQEKITEYLDPEIMVPAVSQGIIGIETAEDNREIPDIISKINHEETFMIGNAERAFLHTLEGGCQVPVGCYTQKESSGYTLTGLCADPEGRTVIRKSVIGSLARLAGLAAQLAENILHAGGDKILHAVRS